LLSRGDLNISGPQISGVVDVRHADADGDVVIVVVRMDATLDPAETGLALFVAAFDDVTSFQIHACGG
jgi:hypothetical protein